jgi:cell division protein FtsI (penicillin-binding protein 3)
MRSWRHAKRQTTAQQPNLPGLFAPQNRTRRLATPHEVALDVARGRLIALSFLFTLAYLIIAARLTDLTLFTGTPEVPMAEGPSTSDVASRADITDRNGVVLATSLPTISLCVDAPKVTDIAGTEKELLSTLPDLDQGRLEEELKSGKHCAMIKRHLTPRQYYDVNKLGIIGLEFRPDERRIYPAGNITAHVVGFTDIDNFGLGGVEGKLNTALEERPEPLALSLDLRVQTILHNELAHAMGEFHAIGAGALVMDVTNGEILGMVSLPDFDPAHPGNASDDARFNRDTLGVYEMGSTFKIFNTAMALDSGLIHVGDAFDTTHALDVGGQTIRDFENEKRWLNVAEIFTHSSNIGAARMAERLGGARQRSFLSRLGLMDKATIEVSEVGAPLMPSARDWSDAMVMTAAFGHGIAVNALQLVGAVATIVNNGAPVHPTLLKEASAPQPIPDQDRVISPHTSAMMRALMRLVVTRGTGKEAAVAGYLVGGKTGTADKIVKGHYTPNARLSSFVGVFPINAPRYLVFAMLDDPKGSAKTLGFATGGMVAAPVVSRVIGQIGPLLDVEPLDADMEAAAERQVLRPLGAEIVDGLPVDEGSSYASGESNSVQ